MPNNGQMNGLPKFRKLHEIIGVYNGGNFFLTQNFKTLKNSKEQLFFKKNCFQISGKIIFSNFSCMFLNPKIFFQFEF